jgi:hypothetical protein
MEAMILLDDSSDENSDDEEEYYFFYLAIKNSRYLSRGTIQKVGHWTADRLASMDEMRARRDLRMKKETFFFYCQKSNITQSFSARSNEKNRHRFSSNLKSFCIHYKIAQGIKLLNILVFQRVSVIFQLLLHAC